MRFGIGAVLVALSLLAAPSLGEVPQIRPIDTRSLVEQLNAARQNPQSYGRGLHQYRAYFHDNLLRYPGLSFDIRTEEGVKVVDEAIAYLGHQARLNGVAPSLLLQRAAAMHLADQARTGGQGHVGSDGTSPGDRVRRLGGGTYVAEIISYGSIDAVDAMRQLIVDDGVADRGHREIIYSAELRFAGAACGPHPVYRTMCIIDLGVTPDGTYPGAGGSLHNKAR